MSLGDEMLSALEDAGLEVEQNEDELLRQASVLRARLDHLIETGLTQKNEGFVISRLTQINRMCDTVREAIESYRRSRAVLTALAALMPDPKT